jgi:nicotinate dehydrogenase subunit A
VRRASLWYAIVFHVEETLILTINGQKVQVQAPSSTPLLYLLRDQLGYNSPLFGCGMGQCGACMVLRGSEAVTSCNLPIADAVGAEITTLEGLGTPEALHPVQQAFIDEQAAQCGYCSNGMLIAAAALIVKFPHPTDEQIRRALDGNLCRCGSHTRILRAVRRAAQLLWEGDDA